ncbi:MAG: hypothetical protein IMZ61_05490 [Planctomycetes bacterium]|nr:hypothetical protein [Planctomycetota bacterium]
MTIPEEKQAGIEELRLRYFYLLVEQAAIEAELKQLGQEPPNSQAEKEKGADHG